MKDNSKRNVLNTTKLVTLVGPPNSGKTTLFNYLSGKKYKAVNYPGSTIEYNISKFLTAYNIDANLLDSPGIVSLNPISPDEKVSINSLHVHPKYGIPDLILVTVDVSQLSRHLLLVKQLIKSGFNLIVVLTMNDILVMKGLNISERKLKEILKCEVVKFDGRNGKGIDALIERVKENLNLCIAGKQKVSKVDYNSTSDNILDIYLENEQIEKDVIFSIDNDIIHKRLNVINNKHDYRPDALTMKIDKILLSKFWGLLIFFLIMTVMFTSIFYLATPVMDLIDLFFGVLSNKASELIGENWFGDLVSNGLIGGVGSVLVFIPQITILFLILGLLEDSGYLARGAMLVDKPLSKIGLNGKSFIPMLSGFACAIPAIMATRTISNRRERFLTIFILPLMTCSARLPVYALMIAFLIPSSQPFMGGITLASIYIFSIISSSIIAGIVNKFQHKLLKVKDDTSFILELPAYRTPKIGIVIKHTLKNAKQYLAKAGGTILILSVILWFLTYFPNINPEIDTQGKNYTENEISALKGSERLATSYASYLGKFIEPVMKPIGMDWRIGVSLIATFAAREVFVSSLALIFKVTSDEDKLQDSIVKSMREATVKDKKLFTPSTIIGLIIFFVFAMQCLSTVAIAKKETGSWRIPVLQIIIYTSLAYLMTFITVNGLRAFGIE